MKKVYLAGPITGIEDDNREAFGRVKALLETKDYDFNVVSPFDLKIKKPQDGTPEQALWNYYMRECLYRLLRNDIEMIFLMEGWKDSKGASAEAYIADKAGIHALQVFEVDGKLVFKDIDAEEEDILLEAKELGDGNRNKAYGHPFDDYSKTCAFWNILWKDKLKEDLTAEDAIMAMIAVKLSREMNVHKRDNLVDGAGYFQCLQKAILKRKELEKKKPE